MTEREAMDAVVKASYACTLVVRSQLAANRNSDLRLKSA